MLLLNVQVEEGSLISIKNVSLPKCTFLKVRAQSVDFLDISNPRAVLEYTLRKYTCVTVGDVIVLQHLGKLFHMDVQEVRPNGAASIVETDVEIDFDEPLGYKDSEYAKYEKKGENGTSAVGTVIKPQQLQKARVDADNDANAGPKFIPFAGNGKRIDGKASTSNTPMTSTKLDNKNDSSMAVDDNTNTNKAITSTKSSSSSFTSQGLTLNSSSVTAASKTSMSMNGSSSSSSSSSNHSTNNNQSAAPQYQSRIGDKYSKKKVAVSAFTGQANKLT